MLDWQKSLFEALRQPTSSRTLSFAELAETAGRIRPGVHEKSVRSFVAKAESAGLLKAVRKGLWLNMGAVPQPSPAEATQRIRKGAVVSLQTVLGDAGVLNNFSSQVYAVVPGREDHKPATGSVPIGGTIFHFRTLPEHILEAGDPLDRLAMAYYPRATAEAALVHWMYLAKSRGSTMKEPDTQCDVSMLDMDRLGRLAEAAGVKDETFDWIRRCAEREELDDEQVGWHGPA